MSRRALHRALAGALLLVFLLAGCEAEAPRQEPLVIMTPLLAMNPVSNPHIRDATAFLKQASAAFAEQYAASPVQPDVKTFNYEDEMEAVTGSLGTPAAPDILFGTFFNLIGYIDMGRAVPLDDILSPALKADLDPQALDTASREGRVYLLPFLSMQNILIYNKELFRRCGLGQFIGKGREIQDWTLPQWQHILDTLAGKLPHGIYPLALFAKNRVGAAGN